MIEQKRLLFVEEDDFYDEILRILVELFHKEYAYIRVRDPGEARDILKKEKIHLIILDLDSARAAKLDFLSELGPVSKLPILAISQEMAQRDRALQKGCSAFIHKPFKVREFSHLLDTLLAP